MLLLLLNVMKIFISLLSGEDDMALALPVNTLQVQLYNNAICHSNHCHGNG